MLGPAVHTRAKRIIVLDTETTGIGSYDRMITLGAVRIEGNELTGKALHAIFDPRQDCHPGATAVHGWDDWTLRFQDLFYDWAPGVLRWLSWADEIVAHHAAFDMRYIQRELRKADVDQLSTETVCTMEIARDKWRGQSAKLDDCLKRVGLARQSMRHGALEDALLTAGLYLTMQGKKAWLPRLDSLPGPKNLRPSDPRPDGPLPRRSTKKAQRRA